MHKHIPNKSSRNCNTNKNVTILGSIMTCCRCAKNDFLLFFVCYSSTADVQWWWPRGFMHHVFTTRTWVATNPDYLSYHGLGNIMGRWDTCPTKCQIGRANHSVYPTYVFLLYCNRNMRKLVTVTSIQSTAACVNVALQLQ